MEGRPRCCSLIRERQPERAKDSLVQAWGEGRDGKRTETGAGAGKSQGRSLRRKSVDRCVCRCLQALSSREQQEKTLMSFMSTRSIHFVLTNSLSPRSLSRDKHNAKHQDVISPRSCFRALTISWEQYLLFLFHLTAVPGSLVCIE